MTDGDRIVLTAMHFEGHHGVGDAERATTQPIEVDVELALDLAPAGRGDDLTRTVDYRWVIGLVREIVERRSFQLIEAMAEAIAELVLERTVVQSVTVRVRKLRVPVEERIAHASVEIVRHRADRPELTT
jgi:dihydroneopterin aldolase